MPNEVSMLTRTHASQARKNLFQFLFIVAAVVAVVVVVVCRNE